jgi:hypothetical protein
MYKQLRNFRCSDKDGCEEMQGETHIEKKKETKSRDRARDK